MCRRSQDECVTSAPTHIRVALSTVALSYEKRIKISLYLDVTIACSVFDIMRRNQDVK